MPFVRKYVRYQLSIFKWLFVLNSFGLILLVIALASPYWLNMKYLKKGSNSTYSINIHGHYGIWSYCTTLGIFINNTLREPLQRVCLKSDTFLTDEEYFKKYEVMMDQDYVPSRSYFTTSSIMAVLALVSMVLSIMLNFYCIRFPRYTIRRLTSVMYFFTAIISYVSIQVFIEVKNIHENRLIASDAKNLLIYYGFGFYFNCLIFLLMIVGFMVFFVFCNKVKDLVTDDPVERIVMEADEPMN